MFAIRAFAHYMSREAALSTIIPRLTRQSESHSCVLSSQDSRGHNKDHLAPQTTTWSQQTVATPNLRSPQGNQLTAMAPPPNTTNPADTKTPANPTNSASRQQGHSNRTEIYDASDKDSIQVETKQYSALDRIKMEREDEKAHPKEPLYPAKGIWKSRLCAIPALLLFGCGGG